ncbi:MAG: hypothetical protein IPM12_15620 [Flavobacteriales bacterium]|nr:hypothetical protein [Flavobacteriales bacterium]
MKYTSFLLCVVLLAGLASCTTTTKVQTSKSMDIYGAGVIQHPVIGELEVRVTKISASLTESSTIHMETLKSMVIADAIKTAAADVLVEPTFTTETTGMRTTITVVGFPANYKNFRLMRTEDVPLLEAGVLQKAKTTEPVAVKKKGGGAAAAGIVLGTLLTIGIVLAAGLP